MADTTVTVTLPDGSKVALPEEIVYFFQHGSVLSQRFGRLDRLDVRYRVTQIFYMSPGSAWADDEPWISPRRWQERKTHKAAVALRDRWLHDPVDNYQGEPVFVQMGVTIWITDEEAKLIPAWDVASREARRKAQEEADAKGLAEAE